MWTDVEFSDVEEVASCDDDPSDEVSDTSMEDSPQSEDQVFESRFMKVWQYLDQNPSNTAYWRQEMKDPDAAAFWQGVFEDGLAPGVKQLLTAESRPTLSQLLDIGWNEEDFLFGVYILGFRRKGRTARGRYVGYVGSAAGLGRNFKAETNGLSRRREQHERHFRLGTG